MDNDRPETSGMYELEFPGPQLGSADGRGPVLIHALEGFTDAGHAAKLAAAHLKASLESELVASFAIAKPITRSGSRNEMKSPTVTVPLPRRAVLKSGWT